MLITGCFHTVLSDMVGAMSMSILSVYNLTEKLQWNLLGRYTLSVLKLLAGTDNRRIETCLPLCSCLSLLVVSNWFVINIRFIRVGCTAHRELDSLFQSFPLVPFSLVHSRICLCVFSRANKRTWWTPCIVKYLQFWVDMYLIMSITPGHAKPQGQQPWRPRPTSLPPPSLSPCAVRNTQHVIQCPCTHCQNNWRCCQFLDRQRRRNTIKARNLCVIVNKALASRLLCGGPLTAGLTTHCIPSVRRSVRLFILYM